MEKKLTILVAALLVVVVYLAYRLNSKSNKLKAKIEQHQQHIDILDKRILDLKDSFKTVKKQQRHTLDSIRRSRVTTSDLENKRKKDNEEIDSDIDKYKPSQLDSAILSEFADITRFR